MKIDGPTLRNTVLAASLLTACESSYPENNVTSDIRSATSAKIQHVNPYSTSLSPTKQPKIQQADTPEKAPQNPKDIFTPALIAGLITYFGGYELQRRKRDER